MVVLALKHAAHAEDIAPLIDRLERHLIAAASQPGAPQALAEVICYLYGVSDVEPDVVEQRIIDRVPSPVREAIMTTAERLRAEGHARGREEGREEGRLSGMARTLLHLLQLKFGPVDPAVRERVEAADEAHLTRWTGHILTAETVAAVFT